MKSLRHLLLFLLTATPGVGHCTNLLANPDFDTSIDHWSPASDAVIAWDSSIDIGSDPSSGSMIILQENGDIDAAASVADCIPVHGGASYFFGGGFLVAAGQPGTPHILVVMALYDGPDCTGSGLTSPGTVNSASVGSWFIKSATSTIDAAALSAEPAILIFNGTDEAFQVHADSMFIIEMPIFDDGFED